MRNVYFLLILLALIIMAPNAKATHIVGGELTYRYLGNDYYEITLNLYQDCYSGNPKAIQEDNPARLSCFNARTHQKVSTDSTIKMVTSDRVPPNFKNDCVNNPPPTCLNKAKFVITKYLPDPDGYIIVYQRCCRNESIINILNPGITGATYSCIIPPKNQVVGNNSAVFKNFPPQIICVNNPLVYDHSAYDPDGDSLSYEFCEAYVGGAANDAAPDPILPAPGDTVQYAPFFSSKKPMTGTPPILINPATGLITGTPKMQGRFVVTVCCHEWRNGIIINTTTREFQFVVTNCSKAVVADIPQYSDEFNTYIVECNSKTVKFVNHSIGGFAYHWDFGIPEKNSDTSSDFEPTFTYPDTGIYSVTLVVNKGSTCPDSITRLVKVYPTFKADFTFDGLHCPGSPIQFTDSSSSTYKPINTWLWNFDEHIFSLSNLQNPVHTFQDGGVYNVKLIAGNIKGCTDTVTKKVEIDKFRPSAGGGDTIIVKGESIDFKASGGVEYTWTPATFLSDSTISNPVGYYPDTGQITYTVHVKSEAGCEGEDTLAVWVVAQSSIFVPTAFSPNGDGLNDVLRPIGIGFRSINFFRVYNRFGEQVYYSTKFKIGWDGKNDGGRDADVGVYYWILSMRNRFGKDEMIKGDVTLIR